MIRRIAWFSCGAASAVAAKLAVTRHGNDVEVVYCDTLAYEHADNPRFMADVERWIGQPIRIIKSSEYTDIMDVFRKWQWLVGNGGARCTIEMKKVPRMEYQRPDDIHIFGFTKDEPDRISRFRRENLDTQAEFPLHEAGLTKQDCYAQLRQAGIELPAMYRLGYRNNNCIGCVKGGMGYWNKIREDFPEDFQRMAKLEREIGASILKDRRDGKSIPVYLDELEPWRGYYPLEETVECGVLCSTG